MDLILYRAMSLDEFKATQKENKPHFIKRFKWFSPSLLFVANRVMDGKFNNSCFKKDRYAIGVKFIFDGNGNKFFNKNSKEWRLDIRKSHQVKCYGAFPLPQKDYGIPIIAHDNN